MICRPPGTEPKPEPESETVVEQPEQDTGGDIVCSHGAEGVVSCPRDMPESYWCENTDDGMVLPSPDTPRPEPETLIVGRSG